MKNIQKLYKRLNILQNRVLKIEIQIKDNYPNHFNRLNKLQINCIKKIKIISKLINN